MDDGRKDVARVIEEQILDRGRLELIPEIFHPDALVHGPIYTIFLRPCHNHAEIRDHVVGNRSGFPDLHHAIHGQIARATTWSPTSPSRAPTTASSPATRPRAR